MSYFIGVILRCHWLTIPLYIVYCILQNILRYLKGLIVVGSQIVLIYLTHLWNPFWFQKNRICRCKRYIVYLFPSEIEVVNHNGIEIGCMPGCLELYCKLSIKGFYYLRCVIGDWSEELTLDFKQHFVSFKIII